MFKELSSGLSKFFNKQMVFTISMLLFLAIVLLYYSGSKSMVVDHMDTGFSNVGTSSASAVQPQVAPQFLQQGPSLDSKPISDSSYKLQPVANPNDLLPTDVNSDWGTFNNINQTTIATPDLLQAGYHIGLDTIGQSLRNANLQLRSDPIISKKDIGPWNMSTIEPDFGRVPLEIGCGGAK